MMAICDRCSKEFPTRLSLVFHLRYCRSCLQPSSFACDFCSKQLSCKQTLVDHLRAAVGHQYATDNVICNQCKMEFPTQQDLILHLRESKLCNNHMCDLCSKQFRQKQSLVEHWRHAGHHDAIDMHKCAICDGCKREFPTKDSLILRSGSRPTPPLFACDLCSKQFRWRVCLSEHLVTANERTCSSFSIVRAQPNAQAKYKCDQCPKRFLSKQGLTEHISTLHQRKRFACGFCGAQFPHHSNLGQHMSNMHGKRKPQCDHCNAKFSQKTHLITHIKSVHLLLRPFKCNQCVSSFTQSSHLNTHISIVHTQPLLECDYCGAKLNGKTSLEPHILGVHMKLNQFKCDKCPAAFSYRSLLRIHNRTIHKAGCVVCDQCEQQCENKQQLGKHCMAVHLGLRPYKCSACAKSFATKGDLAGHKRRMHDRH